MTPKLSLETSRLKAKKHAVKQVARIEARRQETALLVLIPINCLAIIRVHVIKRELDKTRQAITGAKHLASAKFMPLAAISKF